MSEVGPHAGRGGSPVHEGAGDKQETATGNMGMTDDISYQHLVQ